MSNLSTKAMVILFTCCMLTVATDSISSAGNAPLLLTPPNKSGPVVVLTHFALYDINEIKDDTETFEFTGVITLSWRDPRQAFDPIDVGTDEKIFQGNYQFNELSTGWYPQLVLVNEAGLYQTDGVVLRIQADGTSTLIQTLYAAAETDFNMHRYPFDSQRMEAIFEVLGFDRDEVLLKTNSETIEFLSNKLRVPQWNLTGANMLVRDRSAPYAGRLGVSSAFVVSFDVQRESFYLKRLVIIPLVLIVLLSFSVFWMDKSSLGDRVGVSFIGILTAVTYQIMVSDHLPSISYITVMHGFVNLSFLTMCATVIINLVVGALDQRGKNALADRIDLHCRWIFPLAYFGLIFIMVWVATAFF